MTPSKTTEILFTRETKLRRKTIRIGRGGEAGEKLNICEWYFSANFFKAGMLSMWQRKGLERLWSVGD